MDLKSKSMAWVGNIYQKFETIGHDMDEIMNQSQERVKYVENQVQTIGESVKRFYSDVVHDLLPPLVDPVKHEGQVLARKKNAVVGTYKKPVMGIENDHIDAVNKQLCFKTGKTGSVENQPDHAFSGLPLLNQLGTPTHVNSPEGADIDLNSGQIKDISEDENLDEQAEENVKIEMSSTSGVLGVLSSVEEGFSGGPLLNELVDCNHKDAFGSLTNVSPATSVHGTQVESSQNVEKHCDHDCVSDVSKIITSSETNCSVPNEEKMGETEVDSFRSFLLNCHHIDACGSGTNISPATSVHDTQVESSENVERHCDNDCVSDFSITIASPATNISVVSSDDKMAETEVYSLRSSLLDYNHKDACGCITNVSPAASFYGMQVESSQNVGKHCDHDCVLDVSSTIASSKMNFSVVFNEETEVDSSRSSLLNCHCKDACVSGTNVDPATSVYCTKVESSQNVNGHCDNDCFSYVPSTIISLETNLSVVSSNQKMAETEGDSSGSSLLDCNHKDARESGTNVSPVTSVYGTQVESSQNVDRYCDNVCFSDVSSIIASPEANFSVVTCDENMAEIDVDSSRSSLLTEPYYVLTHSPEAFPENAEWYHNSVSMSGAILDGPGAFASFTASHESKVVEMVPSRHVLPLNSIGNNRVELSPAQLKSPTFSSCIGAPSYSGNDDVDYSKLETIELSDKIKLENGCDVVGDSFLYAVSRRSQRLRSFKKKIQDAFASRKRLEKEYEQLAIWFGDAEMGPCQDDLQNFLPSTATKILENRNSHAHICNSDTEWELL